MALLELAEFAVGFIVLGFVAGLVVHHFALGWFISFARREHLEFAVAAAEARLVRRVQRRHRRERASRPRGRHVAEGRQRGVARW